MTPQEKLKAIVDKTDGVGWHEVVDKGTGLMFGPGFIPASKLVMVRTYERATL